MKTLFRTWLTLFSIVSKFKFNIAPVVGAAMIGAGSGFLGMLGQNQRAKKQHARQKELMNIQYKNQRLLNIQGHNQQFDMWKKTNYPAQMEMLKQAGLNPALLYGQSGAGGSTTGSQGGGSAAGGQAAAPMDIGSIIQASMSAAQMKLLEAQAKKTDAEADKISGVDTELTQNTIEKVIAETSNEKAKNRLLNIQGDLEDIEKVYRADKLSEEVSLIIAQATKLESEAYISQQSAQAIIEEAKAKATGQDILNELNTERIHLTKEQTTQVREAIQQKWSEISLHDTEVNIKIAQTIINGLSALGGMISAGKLAKAMQTSKKKMDIEWGKGFNQGQQSMKN